MAAATPARPVAAKPAAKPAAPAPARPVAAAKPAAKPVASVVRPAGTAPKAATPVAARPAAPAPANAPRPVAAVAKPAAAVARPAPSAAKPVAKPAAAAPKGNPITNMTPEERQANLAKARETANANRESLIKQCVEGTLAPRPELAGKRAEYDKKNALGRAGGRPLGLTLGLTIALTRDYLLIQNEKAPEQPAEVDAESGIAIIGSGKMTDEQLAQYMYAEFPGRVSSSMANFTGLRRMYNIGTGYNGMRPKYQSRPYNADGTPAGEPPTGGRKKAAQPGQPKPAAAAPAESADVDEEIAEDVAEEVAEETAEEEVVDGEEVADA